ncbi:protein msb1l isoform X2 [Arctopsyche grandis]|uniref:protein msb1l isoform X2 n=1 Tax=Arctopsyche grandis TaxID=121162 RepID=UPI00406D818C
MGHLYSKAAFTDEGADLTSHDHHNHHHIGNSSSGQQAKMDPRSPTPDINRTPLQTLDSKLQKITKNVDLTKECFEKYETDTIINPSIRALMNQIDPRSPTLDFQRTPLAVLIKNPELMAKYNQINADISLNNSNLFCNEEANISHQNNNIESCQRNLDDELSEHIDNENAEVPKASNPHESTPECSAIVESDNIVGENDCRVPGLLETNLDYIETNLDTVKRKPKSVAVEKGEQADIGDKNACILKIKNLSKKDPRSPSVGINRTPIVLLDSDQENKIQRDEVHSKMQEIFDHNMKLQQKRDMKTLESDFLLIYEDTIDNENSTPIRKPALNPKNESSRTPLACMMNVHQTNKLISDIPEEKNDNTKKSKIPIKIKSAQNIDIHCKKLNPNLQKISKRNLINSIENTPPKPRQARWDQDNSVIL